MIPIGIVPLGSIDGPPMQQRAARDLPTRSYHVAAAFVVRNPSRDKPYVNECRVRTSLGMCSHRRLRKLCWHS